MKDHLAIINNQEGSKHSTRLVTQAVVLILYKREVLFRFRRTTINRRHQKDLKEDTLSSKDLEGLRGGKGEKHQKDRQIDRQANGRK